MSYFQEAEGNKDYIYYPILQIIAGMARPGQSCRVLELGAGRTSFPQFIREHGNGIEVEFIAHDINDTNAEYYAQNAIRFIIGGWAQVKAEGPFDFCFSSFVYEHLVEPRNFLGGMIENLTPTGKSVIVCPKYIIPGYVPPAIRWMPLWKQHVITCYLSLSNVLTKITGRCKFWICVEPTIFFKRPYRRDYDAVHMVSTEDVRAAVSPMFRVRSLPLARSTLTARVRDSLMLLSIVIERNVACSFGCAGSPTSVK
jgi:hypothetical protein